MYSIKYTKERIKYFNSKIDFSKWRYYTQLIPSSLEKVKHYTDHLNSPEVYDLLNGKLLRPLYQDEREWIENEKILSALDFRYWAPRYATLRTTDERLVRFTPNIAQNIALDILGELEEEEVALHIQSLKARQLGLSTLFENMIAHRVLFYPNVNSVVASADDKRSAKLAKMIWTCFDNLPWWMMPEYTTNNVSEKVFGGHNSGISIQHGASVTGVARGDTPSIAHLSELPYWDDPKESVDASLMKAIHDDPSKMVILESTANGMGDWWHNSWEYNKEMWPLRKCRFRPFFLPWFVGKDIYPTKTWLKKTPIPKDWEPDALTIAHAISAEEFVEANDYLKKYLTSNPSEKWIMPPEQMWYWEVSREEAKRKKELQQFFQEMPANDTQAFQASGACPFEPELIIEISDNIKKPWGVFGLVGDEIPSDNIKFCPWLRSELDHDRPPINISAKWKSTLPTYKWTLLPLKWSGWSDFSWEGKIIIWEPPAETEIFGFGVDTAEGLGQDRSVIEGIRIGKYFRPSEQILEFANSQLSADDIWPHCMAIGTFYSRQSSDRILQPRFVIECNKTGENTQNEIRKRGWKHFHNWLRYDHKKIDILTSHRLGWFTVTWSRDMLMSKSIKAIRDKRLIINSPYLLREMQTLSKDEFKQSIRAEQGEHDDRYMAIGMNYFSNFVLEVEGLDNPNYDKSQDIVYATYSNSQAMDIGLSLLDNY